MMYDEVPYTPEKGAAKMQIIHQLIFSPHAKHKAHMHVHFAK